MLLGAHTSIRGGMHNAIDLAKSLGFNCMQVFTKNNNRWDAKPYSPEDIKLYKDKIKDSGIEMVIAHDAYLINLCAPGEELLLKSLAAFIDELERCEQLDIPYLNFHPGSHCGSGEPEGIKLISDSLNVAIDRTKGYNVKLMIETTAGQGSALGYKFEHIRDIIANIEDKSRISVCIDTAHIFAAGYDFRDEASFNKTFQEFDSIVGLEYLKCFHMNDSKKPLGSKVDRHEHIGKGNIGLEGFKLLMNDKRLKDIPKILETPKEKDQLEDIENLNVLKSLIEI